MSFDPSIFQITYWKESNSNILAKIMDIYRCTLNLRLKIAHRIKIRNVKLKIFTFNQQILMN